MTVLAVWRDGTRVGTLVESRRRLRFTYASAAAPMLSVSMPPRSDRYDDAVARPYFAGLLPEGEARRIIAYDLGLGNDGGDDLALLAALGRDSAGALTIIAEGDDPSPGRRAVAGPALTPAEVGARLRDLPAHPLGVSADVHLSLPGVQPKLLLAHGPEGWRVPGHHRVSTHILKPALDLLPASIDNEAFCLALARHLGLAAADTTIEDFDGTRALVVARFDRRRTTDGTTARVHQEDGCQALSIPASHPWLKYQRADDGPSLVAFAAVLDRWARRSARIDLLAQVLVTTVVGNGDLHAKNLSLIHCDDGDIALAPAYDVMSTVLYGGVDGMPKVSTSLALRIGGATDVERVARADLLAEAGAWGLRRSEAAAAIAAVLDRLDAAIDAAVTEVPTVPERLVDLVRARGDALRAGDP